MIELAENFSNGEISAKLANIYRGDGARAALTNIAVGGKTAPQSKINRVLVQLYHEFSSSLFYIKGTSCSAFLVSGDGRVYTAAHCLPPPFAPVVKDPESKSTKPSPLVACDRVTNLSSVKADVVREGGQPFQATLVAMDITYDIAILQMSTPSGTEIKRPSTKEEIENMVAVGFGADHQIQTAAVNLRGFADEGFVLDQAFPGSMFGSPILDSHGNAIGLITAVPQSASLIPWRSANKRATVMPLSKADELYELCRSSSLKQ